MGVSDRIKYLRQLRKMTLDEIAKLVGVNNATVSRWETGEIKNIRSDKFETLAKALKTSTAYLHGYVNDPDALILTSDLSDKFRERVSEILKNADKEDIKAALGSVNAYDNILNKGHPISLDAAYDIADELGASLDYLTGLVDDPDANLPYEDFLKTKNILQLLNDNNSNNRINKLDVPETELQRAEQRLLGEARVICSTVRPKKFPSDNEPSIAEKMDVITYFLNDNEKLLHALMRDLYDKE